jgi:hypothetical protein
MFFEVIFIAITTREAIFNHLVSSQQLNFRSISKLCNKIEPVFEFIEKKIKIKYDPIFSKLVPSVHFITM